MSLLNLFRRKQEDEGSRIARLSKTGRIAEGTILDVITDGNGQVTQVCRRISIENSNNVPTTTLRILTSSSATIQDNQLILLWFNQHVP